MPCEQESNYCGAYGFDAATSLFRAIIERPEIQIGYNRAKGGFDVMIDLPTEDAQILKLAECMSSLVDSMGGPQLDRIRPLIFSKGPFAGEGIGKAGGPHHPPPVAAALGWRCRSFSPEAPR